MLICTFCEQFNIHCIQFIENNLQFIILFCLFFFVFNFIGIIIYNHIPFYQLHVDKKYSILCLRQDLLIYSRTYLQVFCFPEIFPFSVDQMCDINVRYSLRCLSIKQQNQNSQKIIKKKQKQVLILILNKLDFMVISEIRSAFYAWFFLSITLSFLSEFVFSFKCNRPQGRH